MVKAKAKASPRSHGTARAKAGGKALPALPAAPAEPPRVDATSVAKEVLRLGQAGEDDKILGVLGDKIERGQGDGGAVARKAFLRISMLIHPDKLPGFSDATRAFQALVRAFDKHQQGFVPAGGGELKQKALARSNENCFRTEVLCPRCKVPWGSKSEGNPDYYYNFMMQGLRGFTCSTCLLYFGCFSASHRCPWCKRPFEYSVEQYNQKVTCGHADCKRSFGFIMYTASENALRQAREQLLGDYEKRAKKEESKSARAQRAARRAGGSGVSAAACAETAFIEGLRDICPRCGLHLESFDEGAQLRHLRSCNDSRAHTAHREALQRKEKAAEAQAAKNQAQLSAASSAVWTFCGGHIGRLWMLDEEQLKKRCKMEGLAVRGSHAAVVGRLADHCASRGDAAGNPSETVPRVLDGLSDDRLSAICAAHRLHKLVNKDREEQVEALEELRDGGAVRLQDTKGRKSAIADKAQAALPRGAAKGKAKAIADAPMLALPAPPSAAAAEVRRRPAAAGAAPGRFARGMAASAAGAGKKGQAAAKAGSSKVVKSAAKKKAGRRT